MNDTDLLNLLRHAFLLGHAEGIYCERSVNKAIKEGKSASEASIHYDFDTNDRDGCLKELMSECKSDGGCSYGDDCGSACEEDCIGGT